MIFPPDSFAILPPIGDGDQPGGAAPSPRPAPCIVCDAPATVEQYVSASTGLGVTLASVRCTFCDDCADLDEDHNRLSRQTGQAEPYQPAKG